MKSKNDAKFHIRHNFFEAPLSCGDISVVQIGRLYFQPNARIGAHLHKDWFELTVITSGRGVIRTGEDEVTVEKGDIHLSYPHESHDICSDATQSLCYDFFAFRCNDEMRQLLSDIASRNPDAASRVFRDERIRRLVPEGIAAVSDDGPFAARLRADIFEQIVIYVIRDRGAAREKVAQINADGAEMMCYQIMSYIDTHLATLQRLSDLEEVFHYSYGYLSKLFKRTCGRSLIDYYSERRLEAARAMLLSEHLSVTTVAERMNYASVYSFSRIFKEKYGISPEQIKRLEETAKQT